MSRAAASSPASQNPIWQLTTKLPQGLLSTIRTQQLGESSFQIDEGVLAFVTMFLLNYNKPASITDKFAHTRISTIDWINILNIALGFGPSRSLQTLRQAATAHLLSRNQLNLLRPAGASLFPVIPIHINQLIEAILHGDEKMVRDILNAAPALLLKKGTATDFQGRPFTGTPLQTAIAVDDIAPNTNSTGTVEIILEQLKQFDPVHYHTIFEEQACELYKKSLAVYVEMQEKEIARLDQLAGSVSAEVPEAEKQAPVIEEAQKKIRTYKEALRGDDLNTLFETHKKAQADNVFDFQPYADAIINATQAELDNVAAIFYTDELAFSDFDPAEIQELQQAANSMPTQTADERAFVAKIRSISQLNNNGGQAGKFSIDQVRWLVQFADKTNRKALSAKLKAKIKVNTDAVVARTGVAPTQTDECRILPFDQLTLVQKLNRLREKMTEHTQAEIIFNPHHTLAGLKANEDVWDTLPHSQDPDYYKRAVVFSQCAGAAQDRAPEPVKQDLRQGTYYLTERNEPRSRAIGFNDWDVNLNIVRNSFVDPSFVSSSSFSLGYKFAADRRGAGGRGWRRGSIFSKLMSSKNSKLSELITPRVQSTRCVIQ